jgi:hypothetical protein
VPGTVGTKLAAETRGLTMTYRSIITSVLAVAATGVLATVNVADARGFSSKFSSNAIQVGPRAVQPSVVNTQKLPPIKSMREIRGPTESAKCAWTQAGTKIVKKRDPKTGQWVDTVISLSTPNCKFRY